jgi:hypothetical protein
MQIRLNKGDALMLSNYCISMRNKVVVAIVEMGKNAARVWGGCERA